MSMVTMVAKVTIIARIEFCKICDFLAVLPTYEPNESFSDDEEYEEEDDEEFTCIFEYE